MKVHKDISIYEDTKRNEKCPCGSGKIFKKCCMKEYREAKKDVTTTAKLSSYTPLQSLTKSQKEAFTRLYQDLLIFSNQHENQFDAVYLESEDEQTTTFLARQRDYFYENADNVIDAFIEAKDPTPEQCIILDDLREAKFDNFYLMSHSEHSAVLMEGDGKLYNIQPLHSSFEDIFKSKSKYQLLGTALIPYGDYYISDGLYTGTDKLPDKVERSLDQVAYQNPIIHYNRDNKLINIPLVLNFAVFCAIDHFKEMEDMILKNIPLKFSEGLISLFDNKHSHRINVISSFLRSTDLAHELNNDEGEQTLSYIIGGSPVLNFEFGNKTDVIPYEILEKYYVQKPIEKSQSFNSYNKSINKDPLVRMVSSYSSFYSILGIAHIDEDKMDDFYDNLEIFNTKKKREELSVGMENLFEELSEKAGFEITPVFLGAGEDLDSIYTEIELYREYMQDHTTGTLEECKIYSINKHGF